MGLEFAELTLAVEEHFCVSIDDDALGEVLTIGDFVDVVYDLVPHGGARDHVCRTAQAFYRLRRALVELIPVQRDQVRPTTVFAQIVPLSRRQPVWAALEARGLKLPPLVLGPQSAAATFAAVVTPVVWTGLWLGSWKASVGLLPLGIFAHRVTRRYAQHIPGHVRTLGGAAEHLVLHSPDHNRWTRPQLARRVLRIVSDQLDIPVRTLNEAARWRDVIG